MTRRPPASGLVLRQYDDKAYRVYDRTTGADLGYVIARPDDWIVHSSDHLPLAIGWTRDWALQAAWPDLWPTRPAERRTERSAMTARCQECGREITLTKNGAVRYHGGQKSGLTEWPPARCPGAGLPPDLTSRT